MKLSKLSRRIKVCYVGPDDCGIWERTLNFELRTLFESLEDAKLIDRPHLEISGSTIQGYEGNLDRREKLVTNALNLEDDIKAADLVVVYLTRSNLYQCNWAIGLAQGMKKKVVVLDALYPNEITSWHDHSCQDFSYEVVMVDESHPNAEQGHWVNKEHPIKCSARRIASFILQNTELYRVPMIPRGKWILVSLRAFWQGVIEQCWKEGDDLEKLKGITAIYGCPEFMFTAEGWGVSLTNPLGIEYKDEQTYKDLGSLMTRCHPQIGRIGTRHDGIAHVWPDEFGIRQMSVHEGLNKLEEV